MEADEVVLSEVHLEQPALQPGCEAAATTFIDSAGRPLVSVHHALATPLRTVGLQVWRGALLLADLLLHRGPAAFAGATALELGAGSGLAGLVLAGLGPRCVYLTGTACPPLRMLRVLHVVQAGEPYAWPGSTRLPLAPLSTRLMHRHGR